MDSQTIAARLQNPEILMKDNISEWEAIIEKYPYFNIAQWLKYSHDLKHNAVANVEFVAQYKNAPIQFSQWNQKVTNPSKPNPTVLLEVKKEVLDEVQTMKFQTEENQENKVSTTIKSDTFQTHQPVVIPLEQDGFMEKINNLSTPLDTISADENEEDKSLMVMMSFTDWLNHFKQKTQKEKEELHEKKALKTSWQKEKLAAAVEEEDEEIPEGIFKQAMDSISDESIMISEPLAKILGLQGKKDKAIEMYKKLSLRNPEKSAYFANLIKELNNSNP